MPMINPRASALQCGAKSPEKAGTKHTSPVSSTCWAISSESFVSEIICKLSLSQLRHAPAIATLPCTFLDERRSNKNFHLKKL